jgi:hypothetical protein
MLLSEIIRVFNELRSYNKSLTEVRLLSDIK